jgi:uncharacterized protein (TIGR02569 family)
MRRAPPDRVIRAFGAFGDVEPLPGGEGRSFRVGNMVVKPCDDVTEWAWLGRWLPTVRQDAFRLALPLRAGDGSWVVEGWCAQPVVEGQHTNEWVDVLLVCRAFHRAVTHLPRPGFIDARTHAWSIGDRVAWDGLPSPVPHSLLVRLLDVRRDVRLPAQMIHGDLSGNVLADNDLAPAVIDVTPYWRPGGYADAIVVGDALLWHDADAEVLFEACRDIREFAQLFVRAIIYRLVTTLITGVDDPSTYEPVVARAEEFASR